MKEVDLLINCPVCGSEYKNNDTGVVKAKDSAMLVHASCSHCQSSFLAMVTKGYETEGMVSMGMLTDLDYEEACRFLGGEPVTADEVLDLYEKNSH